MKKIYALFFCVFLLSCEDNTFDNVKPVVAPPASKKTTEKHVGKAKGIPGGPKSGELPSNHPSVAGSPKRVLGTPSKVPKNYGKSGPLRWAAPSTWKANPPSNAMRLAEYQMEGIDGSSPAVLAVYQLGGSVETNIARWVGQFKREGKPVKATKKTTQVVGSLTIHRVDVFGTFNSGMAGGNRPDEDSQRLLGAIVETKVGLYFFKLIGPKVVVDKEEAHFDALVASFKAGS